MKFELDDLEQGAIRAALIGQIKEYEDVLGFDSISEKDKEFFARHLERTKSAFKKISGGQTIEEYRETVNNF